MTNLEPWQEKGNKKTNLSVVDILFHAKCVHLVTRLYSAVYKLSLHAYICIPFIPPQLQYGCWFGLFTVPGVWMKDLFNLTIYIDTAFSNFFRWAVWKQNYFHIYILVFFFQFKMQFASY